MYIGIHERQLLMVLLNLPSMVKCAAVMLSRGADFLTDDICQLPIISEAIQGIVARFTDLHADVRKSAVNVFIELARHSNATYY